MLKTDPVLVSVTRQSERLQQYPRMGESLLAQTLNNFMLKIKLRRWDNGKNLQNRLSGRAPLESFITFYRGLKLMTELVRI